MTTIAVLSEELINQIAAGEVVERPASVVKELCENALDAGARTIRVALEQGGMGRIVISDDGHGMGREDARLCLLRHATSKLRDFDGLSQLSTKGFRGEAVPAVASVSRFTLHTSTPGAASGTRIRVEGGGPPEVEEAEPAGGTTIQVDELFYNVPARRKFLKRESTELKHAEEAALRLALAHPEVGFFVTHGGVSLLASPPCPDDPTERIAAALGPEVHPHLLAVEERRLGISVTGHVASPEYTLPTARGLYTFVNRRYVRDRGVTSAIQRAFQDALPPGRQPVAVLFVDVDPRAVDVNVHPQKLEVRFADPSGVHDTVFAAVSHALKTAPWLQAMAGDPAAGASTPAAAHYALAVERFLTRAQSGAGGGGGRAFAPLPVPGEGPAGDGGPGLGGGMGLGGVEERAPAFGQAQPQLNDAPPPAYFASLRPLGALARRFHVCEGPGGTLVVVDPHAALERVRLAAFRRALEKGREASSQSSLFSATLTFTPDEARGVAAGLPALRRLGFALEPFGGTTFALSALPAGMDALDALTVVRDVSLALPPPGSPLDASTLAEALRVMACHAAGPASQELSADALKAVLRELDGVDFHVPCKHRTVVVHDVPLLELERRAR
jgi:DNA mismatch repair protein MutL